MRLVNSKHLVGALRHSVDGLLQAWRQEQAFRHEVLLCPVIIVLLLIIRPGWGWGAALAGGWCIVMAVELLNSAIEEAFDLLSPEYNIHVKYGKDMASAAILMALVLNGILWVFMFCDRFF